MCFNIASSNYHLTTRELSKKVSPFGLRTKNDNILYLFGFMNNFHESLHRAFTDFDFLTLWCPFYVVLKKFLYLRTHKMELDKSGEISIELISRYWWRGSIFLADPPPVSSNESLDLVFHRACLGIKLSHFSCDSWVLWSPISYECLGTMAFGCFFETAYCK